MALNLDVAVVGGGPAGAAAAITLARAGRSVAIFDKATFPRDKCCGDGLTTGALRRLERLGVRPEAIPSWTPVSDIWVRTPRGRVVGFPLPRTGGVFGAVARRVELDAALVDAARDNGASVHDGHGVTSVTHGGGAVDLEVDGIGAVRAGAVVAADGMWSPTRKLLGASDEPGYLGEWHAFRQYFSDVAPAARDQLWVWFEPDLLPGYAWSFPLAGGAANVGFGIHRSSGRSGAWMHRCWAELLERPHVRELLGPRARPQGPHKAWPIPARIGRSALSAGGGRVLFAGDAARATDSMTGEGIGQALETGALAAVAILGGGSATAVATRYERSVTRGLGLDDRLAARLSGVLAHERGADAAVALAGRSNWTRRNFARWMFEDYPRAVLVTPRRWHRNLFHGLGTFRGCAAPGCDVAAAPR